MKLVLLTQRVRGIDNRHLIGEYNIHYLHGVTIFS